MRFAKEMLTAEQAKWVEAILANDEVSSDEELLELFIRSGIDVDSAQACIRCRQDYLSSID